MNIQIYGKSKCYDTQKAQRYFRERKISCQSIDLPRYGMGKRELESVLAAVGSIDSLLDPKSPDAALVKYLSRAEDRLQKLVENPRWLRTPIVRNGRAATVGYCPEIWKTWEESL